MDKHSAIEILTREAEASELLGETHCRRGDHRQAAWRFGLAGDYYSQAGLCLEAARCYASQYSEEQWVRPADPINISALTD